MIVQSFLKSGHISIPEYFLRGSKAIYSKYDWSLYPLGIFISKNFQFLPKDMFLNMCS
jgi:hypothetical protein